MCVAFVRCIFFTHGSHTLRLSQSHLSGLYIRCGTRASFFQNVVSSCQRNMIFVHKFAPSSSLKLKLFYAVSSISHVFCCSFSPASHARRACEARALRPRKTTTPRFTYFFTHFEKKWRKRLFCSLTLHGKEKFSFLGLPTLITRCHFVNLTSFKIVSSLFSSSSEASTWLEILDKHAQLTQPAWAKGRVKYCHWTPHNVQNLVGKQN